MKRSLLAVGVLVLTIQGATAAVATATCPATRVRGNAVHAGPFSGQISRPWDVLDGRFRLRPGGYRDRDTGLTQKIPWFVSRRSNVTRRLTIVGRRLGGRRGRFVMRLGRTTGVGDHERWVYPSNVAPPSAGCWRLRFTSGGVHGRLTVLVKPD